MNLAARVRREVQRVRFPTAFTPLPREDLLSFQFDAEADTVRAFAALNPVGDGNIEGEQHQVVGEDSGQVELVIDAGWPPNRSRMLEQKAA